MFFIFAFARFIQIFAGMEAVTEKLIALLREKSLVKQEVFANTFRVFKLFKESAQNIADEVNSQLFPNEQPVRLEYKEVDDFKFYLKFSGDVILMQMHTNVWTFGDNHKIYKSQYVEEDYRRAFCGKIMLFNFLSDSIKYNRINDTGYSMGRLFINRDNHFFMEGERQFGFLFDNFATSVISQGITRYILQQAMIYAIETDLVSDDYQTHKPVTVHEILGSDSPIATKKIVSDIL